MKRILGLDIVRTIAIMQVVLIHSTYQLSSDIKDKLLSFIPSIDGVSIFFVLSGFLIGGILLRITEKENLTWGDFLQFWIRRWFRTLPNYFLILVALFAYDILIYRSESEFSFRYIFFIQNFATNHPDFFPEAWSLSVEEWFYLLYPLSIYIGFKLLKNRRYVILFNALIFLVIPLVLRIYVHSQGAEFENLELRKIVVFRLDSLMFGIIGAYLYRYHLQFWGRIKIWGLMFSVLLVIFLTICNYYYKDNLAFWRIYSFEVESLATLLALPFFSSLTEMRSRKLGMLFSFISVTSYSMYLLNLSVIQWRVIPAFLSVTHLKSVNPMYLGGISYFLFWLFLLGFSYLLYRFYEVPMMNLREKFSFGNH